MKTVLESLFNKVEKGDFLLKRLFIKKETSTQVFSGEYCEKIKKFFFKEPFRWLLLRIGESYS